MEFAWSEIQSALYDQTLAVVRGRLGARQNCPAETEHFTRAEWALCAEMGLLGISVPKPFGGLGLDALTTARVMEAFGRGCIDMGLVFSVGAHLFAATMPIVEFGQPELQEELLPKLVSGTAIGANAITEAGAGSDAFALATRARAVDDGYVLDGSKLYVTNGPVADVFVVYATENPKLGYLGISAFAVEATRAGVSVGRPLRKMGLTRSPMSEVYFSECKLPSRNLLGKPGQGAAVFQASMRWERACLFAAYVGMLERQLEQSVDHARERRQGGRAIGRYQAVSHRLVDMKLRLESSRLLLYRACWLLDRGDDAEAAISLSKLAISEAARQSSLDAIQLHGGMGYLSEPQIECMLRDSIPTTIFSGTSEVQRDLIARELGL